MFNPVLFSWLTIGIGIIALLAPNVGIGLFIVFNLYVGYVNDKNYQEKA